MAEEEHYWIADNRDKHLTAILGVLVEPVNAHQRRFHVFTIVQYHNWAGPVYLQIIKPFHHLVVTAMAREGVKQRRQAPEQRWLANMLIEQYAREKEVLNIAFCNLF